MPILTLKHELTEDTGLIKNPYLRLQKASEFLAQPSLNIIRKSKKNKARFSSCFISSISHSFLYYKPIFHPTNS